MERQVGLPWLFWNRRKFLDFAVFQVKLNGVLFLLRVPTLVKLSFALWVVDFHVRDFEGDGFIRVSVHQEVLETVFLLGKGFYF